MKKWTLIAPLTLAAAGAAALGVLTLLKREAEVLTPAAHRSADDGAMGTRQSGSYSFISGYKDAATVELSLDYDAEKYSFAVVGEDFLSYTSDSHVAIVRGEDFSFQLEYAAYYQGEGFEDLIRHVSERYQSFAPVAYGENTGLRYRAGDNLCLCFPAGDDPYSYLLLTLFKGAGYDGELEELVEHPDLSAMLSSLRLSRH